MPVEQDYETLCLSTQRVTAPISFWVAMRVGRISVAAAGCGREFGQPLSISITRRGLCNGFSYMRYILPTASVGPRQATERGMMPFTREVLGLDIFG